LPDAVLVGASGRLPNDAECAAVPLPATEDESFESPCEAAVSVAVTAVGVVALTVVPEVSTVVTVVVLVTAVLDVAAVVAIAAVVVVVVVVVVVGGSVVVVAAAVVTGAAVGVGGLLCAEAEHEKKRKTQAFSQRVLIDDVTHVCVCGVVVVTHSEAQRAATRPERKQRHSCVLLFGLFKGERQIDGRSLSSTTASRTAAE
jgi:hypothetical protein